jgi:hypothetical protein
LDEALPQFVAACQPVIECPGSDMFQNFEHDKPLRKESGVRRKEMIKRNR